MQIYFNYTTMLFYFTPTKIKLIRIGFVSSKDLCKMFVPVASCCPKQNSTYVL